MLQLPLSRARPCSHAAGSRRQSAAVQSTRLLTRRTEPNRTGGAIMRDALQCGRRCNATVALQRYAMHATVRPTVGWMRSDRNAFSSLGRVYRLPTGPVRAMHVRCPTAAWAHDWRLRLLRADEGRAEDARAPRASPWLGRSRGAPPPCETALEYCAQLPWRH